MALGEFKSCRLMVIKLIAIISNDIFKSVRKFEATWKIYFFYFIRYSMNYADQLLR